MKTKKNEIGNKDRPMKKILLTLIALGTLVPLATYAEKVSFAKCNYSGEKQTACLKARAQAKQAYAEQQAKNTEDNDESSNTTDEE
jgi:hypothetical protein